MLYNELARSLKKGQLLNDNIFKLFERSDDGSIIKVKYCGAWLVVNNSYLNWGFHYSSHEKNNVYHRKKVV